MDVNKTSILSESGTSEGLRVGIETGNGNVATEGGTEFGDLGLNALGSDGLGMNGGISRPQELSGIAGLKGSEGTGTDSTEVVEANGLASGLDGLKTENETKIDIEIRDDEGPSPNPDVEKNLASTEVDKPVVEQPKMAFSHREVQIIFIAMALCIFLASLDGTIVATALVG
jgi:hypothetical protein